MVPQAKTLSDASVSKLIGDGDECHYTILATINANWPYHLFGIALAVAIHIAIIVHIRHRITVLAAVTA